MGDIPTEAAKAAAQATASTEAKKPQPLTTGEQIAATCLFIAGLVVVGVTLFAFSTTDKDFTFKAKEKTVTEPVAGTGKTSTAQTAKGQCRKGSNQRRQRCRQRLKRQSRQNQRNGPIASVKRTRETDYSDTVAIFALTVGAALALTGGFYARIRSLKLGGLELGFVDPDALKAAAERAKEKVEEQKIADPVKEDAAVAAAQQVAVADVTKAAALGVQPTTQIVEGIADQAAIRVTKAIG